MGLIKSGRPFTRPAPKHSLLPDRRRDAAGGDPVNQAKKSKVTTEIYACLAHGPVRESVERTTEDSCYGQDMIDGYGLNKRISDTRELPEIGREEQFYG